MIEIFVALVIVAFLLAKPTSIVSKLILLAVVIAALAYIAPILIIGAVILGLFGLFADSSNK